MFTTLTNVKNYVLLRLKNVKNHGLLGHIQYNGAYSKNTKIFSSKSQKLLKNVKKLLGEIVRKEKNVQNWQIFVHV